MSSKLFDWLSGVGRLIYPPTCLLCTAPFDPHDRHSLCPPCVRSLTHDPFAACQRCGSSVGPHVATDGDCSTCKSERFAFDGVVRFGVYDDRLKEAILRMKHLAGESLAETLGLLWAERDREKFRQLRPDVVMPVPLHWLRRVRRGYSQSAALARSLAETVGVSYHDRALRRIKYTPKQFTQTPAARRENLKGAFRTTRRCRVQDLRVVLVDDVLTTGATCHEAAKALKAAGAAQVWVAALAHR